MNAAGFGTLLVDLLTTEEDSVDRLTAEYRFDIELLARRLVAVSDWLAEEQATSGLPLGLFGASTGAATALICAAQRPGGVAAFVSRGGRPDLAEHWLHLVKAPTLLIAGGADEPAIGMNKFALVRLTCPKQLVIVPGATHLFQEPGALDRVTELAVHWFGKHCSPDAPMH